MRDPGWALSRNLIPKPFILGSYFKFSFGKRKITGSDSAFASWSTFNCFSAISLTVNNEERFLVLPRSGNTHLICGVMIHGSRFQLWNHLLSVEHWLCNKTRNLKVDFHNQNLDQMKLGISAQSELSPGSKLLEMVRNKEAWHVAVHGVTKSLTWLSS